MKLHPHSTGWLPAGLQAERYCPIFGRHSAAAGPVWARAAAAVPVHLGAARHEI